MTCSSGGVLFTVLWEGIEKYCAGLSRGALLGPSGSWFVLWGPDSLTGLWSVHQGPDSVPQALSCFAGPWLIPRDSIRPGVLIRPVGPRLVSLGLIRPTGPWFVLRGLGFSHGAHYSSCRALASPLRTLIRSAGPDPFRGLDWSCGPSSVPNDPDSYCGVLVCPAGPLIRPAEPWLVPYVGHWYVLRGPAPSHGTLLGPSGSWVVLWRPDSLTGLWSVH